MQSQIDITKELAKLGFVKTSVNFYHPEKAIAFPGFMDDVKTLMHYFSVECFAPYNTKKLKLEFRQLYVHFERLDNEPS